MDRSLVLTCEHGGYRIPKPWQPLFRTLSNVLRSHRGYDAGSLAVADTLARNLNAPLFSSDVSRMLIDLNRSPHHGRLFSEVTRNLPVDERETIINLYYRPHREAVEQAFDQLVASGTPVLHIAVHSFAPELDGTIRRADIGLLYDPSRSSEKAFCNAWRKTLTTLDRSLRVRFNYPYLGKADGLTTWFRRRYGPKSYLGIELELNQRILGQGGRRPGRPIVHILSEALTQAYAELDQEM